MLEFLRNSFDLMTLKESKSCIEKKEKKMRYII